MFLYKKQKRGKMAELSAINTDVYGVLAEMIGISVETLMILLFILGIWSLIWKGFALWKSSKKNHLVWFVVLLVLNTLGILEILYIFIFSKINLKKKSPKK